MLNVLCVRVGQKYEPEYVYKLKNMVERHLKQPHRFLCLTDDPKQLPGIDTIRAPIQIKDSWCKIGLFYPNLETVVWGDECLYLDLDVIITGSLDKLIEGKLPEKGDTREGIRRLRKDLWIAKDWRDPFNSSVMYWEHGSVSQIYMAFKNTDIQRLRGDQNLIAEVYPTAKTFKTSDIMSYKFDGIHKKDKKPEVAKVVLFHGKPKMSDLPDVQWIQEEWR